MLTLFIILMCLAFVATLTSECADYKRLLLAAAFTLLFTLATVGVWIVQRGGL